MNLRLATIALSALALAGAGICRGASDENLDAATKARIAVFDKGPSSIDVSNYPSAIKKDYRAFNVKCALCHTIARPINSDFALPDEWSRYVKRMMFKPGSMISRNDAKKIYTFLAYDSSVRKKDQVAAKLAKLPPADRAAEQAKLDALHKEYDRK